MTREANVHKPSQPTCFFPIFTEKTVCLALQSLQNPNLPMKASESPFWVMFFQNFEACLILAEPRNRLRSQHLQDLMGHFSEVPEPKFSSRAEPLFVGRAGAGGRPWNPVGI